MDSRNRIQRKKVFEYHSTLSRCDDFDNTLNELLHIKLNSL